MTNQETNMVANLLRRVDALESLIREVLADEPKSVCEENGTDCPFCYQQYRAEMPHKGFHVVHCDDCWIERAKRLLAE